MTRIDLNCDMGELPEQIADGTQEALMKQATSVNVACGGHAGDEATMEATIRAAMLHGRAIGAHPGYPDRASFGRAPMALSPEEIATTVHQQIVRLAAIADRCGATLRHVKPHGALYNQAADDAALADAIARGVERFSRKLVLVALAGSPALEVFARAGFRVAAEGFADRRYEPGGRLRSRALPDALLTEPREAAEQALRIARDGMVVAAGGAEIALRADTLCLHGDTPGAVSIAAAIAARLRAAGVAIAPLGAGERVAGHPANAGLRRNRASARPGSAAVGFPEEIQRPYESLGTHPDLVARLWDQLGGLLPADCRLVFCGSPALAHPGTGIVFAFAEGTRTYALRLPEAERREALRQGADRVTRYPAGAQLDLNDVGEEWIFCRRYKDEEAWCRAAYDEAGRAGGTEGP